MKVTVEDIPEVPVGNKGILLRIKDENGVNLGKLWIGQANVRWAAGSKPESSAKKLSMKAFIEMLNKL